MSTIDRQAAIDALERVASFFPYKVCGDRETYSQYNEAWNDAIGRAEMEIEQLPPAQPNVVRCKDCKYSSETPFTMLYCNRTNTTGWDYDGFCSDAERRTDERSD